jgi:LysR family glycine cleavage system transcriptional activator
MSGRHRFDPAGQAMYDPLTATDGLHREMKIPPLNPLRVFEVVARTENLTSAAAELHVSQSAVSRQVAVLEAYLGVQLFRRERLGVKLTDAGRRYATQIAPAFEAIGRATEQLTGGSDEGTVRVRAYTTFTARWLIPRLPEFKRRHPDLEVVISNAVPEVDFTRDPVDVAVLFGDGRWPAYVAELLFQDEIEPVCSPALAERLSPTGKDPERLLSERLLVSRYRRTDWDDWLAFAGIDPGSTSAQRMMFSSSVLTWQAAIDGLGIAIGQSAMLGRDFQAARLVRPFGRPLRRPLGHYIVRPALQRWSRKVESFVGWMLDASRPERAGDRLDA